MDWWILYLIKHCMWSAVIMWVKVKSLNPRPTPSRWGHLRQGVSEVWDAWEGISRLRCWFLLSGVWSKMVDTDRLLYCSLKTSVFSVQDVDICILERVTFIVQVQMLSCWGGSSTVAVWFLLFRVRALLTAPHNIHCVIQLVFGSALRWTSFCLRVLLHLKCRGKWWDHNVVLFLPGWCLKLFPVHLCWFD